MNLSTVLTSFIENELDMSGLPTAQTKAQQFQRIDMLHQQYKDERETTLLGEAEAMDVYISTLAGDDPNAGRAILIALRILRELHQLS